MSIATKIMWIVTGVLFSPGLCKEPSQKEISTLETWTHHENISLKISTYE